MNKQNLINNFNDIYCRIGVSQIHGVGVIAIRDIPKNINPFKMTNNYKEKTIALAQKDLKNIPKEVKKMVQDFIAPVDGKYDVPLHGLNSMDITFYMNHDENNNVTIVDTGETYLSFLTKRNIKKGEELTINYNDYKMN